MNLINFLRSKFTKANTDKSPHIDLGESIACRFLKKNGYKILEKNHRCRYGEIDIIAREKEALCFIEVKSRKSTRFGLPEEYVDARKQKKLLKTAMSYLRKNENPDIDMRFDVISVDLKKNTCRNIKNAFDAQG